MTPVTAAKGCVKMFGPAKCAKMAMGTSSMGGRTRSTTNWPIYVGLLMFLLVGILIAVFTLTK